MSLDPSQPTVTIPQLGGLQVPQGVRAFRGAPVVPPLRAGRAARAWSIVALVVLPLLLVAVVIYLFIAFGPELVAGSAALAVIPLAVVILAAIWIDAWEPEPWVTKVIAFLWGSSAAISIALLSDLAWWFLTHIPDSSPLAFAVRAPIVEETAKGVIVLILALAARRTFDGPVDGIVYAAIAAGGFAFVENIQYFGQAIYEGEQTAWQTFVLRGIFSPFAHVLFTSCTGLAVGLASRRGGAGRIVAGFFCGLPVAIGLHALWNFGTSLAFWPVYLLIEVPIFVCAVVAVVLLRVSEQRTTRTRLDDYRASGWFTPDEIMLYGTRSGRRRVRAWARQKGRDAPALVRAMVRETGRLALDRDRVVRGNADRVTLADESARLGAISASRARLYAIG